MRAIGKKGYTFTISIILISAAIITLAAFALEWRKSQGQAQANLAHATQALRLSGIIGYDFSSLIGQSTQISKNGTHASVSLQTTFPFSKEGLALANLSKYSRQIPMLVKEHPYELVLVSNGFMGQQATVVNLPDSGAYSHSNNGQNNTDNISYTHPQGWSPAYIDLSIYCEKNYESIVPLAASGGGSPAINYTVAYSDLGSKETTSILADPVSITSYSVNFSDGTNLSFISNLSADGNLTTVSYTKSPSAHLVLTFDSNVSSTDTGAILDYSQFANNMTLGGGTQANAPLWEPGCIRGYGCYRFDGSDDYINRSNIDFTQAEVSFPPTANLLSNNDFETYEGTQDDGETDTFENWGMENPTAPNIYFDSTATAQSGSNAVKIYSTDSPDTDRIYQQVSLVQNARYMVSFWTRGDGSTTGKYRVYDEDTGNYLQDDGSWSGEATPLDTGVSGSTWQQIEKEFVVPTGSSTIDIEFVPATSGGDEYIFYVDNVTFYNSTNFNGGFEYYSGPDFNNWAVGAGSAFSVETTHNHSGTAGLKMENDANNSGSYIANSQLALKNSTKYSLQFWAKIIGAGEGGNIRYAIYDVSNDNYLNSSGQWQPSDGGTVVLSTLVEADYTKVTQNFMTNNTGTGIIQIRFYVPVPLTDVAYVDDASITQVYDFTVLAWVKSQELPSGSSLIYQYGTDEFGNAQGIDFAMASSENLSLGIYSSGVNITPSIKVADGRWHMLCLAVNRTGNYSAYLDGSLVLQAGAQNLGTINTSSQFLIGSNELGGATFNGMIDEIRLYKRLLSHSQVYDHYKGKYQDTCTINLTASYSNSSLQAMELLANYNAELRVRSRSPYAVSLFPFDSNVSSSNKGMVTDYSSKACHGTLGASSSPTWTQNGKIGGAYTFDGRDDFIELASQPIPNTTFTVSAWVNAASFAFSNKYNRIVSIDYGAYSSDNPFTLFVRDNGAIGYVFGTGNAYTDLQNPLSFSPNLTIDVWYHIAFTFNGTSKELYVNGQAQGTVNNSSTFSNPNQEELIIGDFSALSTDTGEWEGTIDEVRLFNRSFSAQEITGLYADSALVKQGSIVASHD